MMMRLTRSVALVAVVLLCVWRYTHAGFWDGNELVKNLREGYERAERHDPNTNWLHDGLYTGFVVGVFDANSESFCRPDGVSVRQISTIVEDYLNAHPEQWSQPAHMLVMRALRAAFPCR
jgi:Rap1a immunity proteins